MRFLTCLLICIMPLLSLAQHPFKSHESKPVDHYQPFQPAEGLQSLACESRIATSFVQTRMNPQQFEKEIQSYYIASSGSLWIELKNNNMYSSRMSVDDIMQKLIFRNKGSRANEFSWKESARIQDHQAEHIRVQQQLDGLPIVRQDMILHIRNGELSDLNGFIWTGPVPSSDLPAVSKELILEKAIQHLEDLKVNVLPHTNERWHRDDQAVLAWLPWKGSLKKVFICDVHPNIMDHWTLYIDASTMEVYEAYSNRCELYHHNKHHEDIKASSSICTHEPPSSEMLVMDGPTMVNDQDLLGQNRVVHGYQVGSAFYMIDASRPGMFSTAQSVMPDEPVGVLWTIDGQNRSPQNDNFELVHVSNTNNNWNPLEVSAHHNAGQAFEYFRQKFNRNSLNGSGGNIISVINIKDENGNNLDNAYWNGAAMWYGNGNVAFQPLAKSLDVAGHEMSHGVIQNTANLEYMNQSGALNESFADVFGAMIDRDDWRLGEDVVNLSFFPSGALRDLSDPHNGGNDPNDNGWQPRHMNEFQNLPNTPEGDNGGVHVNSGIPNHAFFLFASSIGKEKAEQVYYKALRDYLVKSSQFVDLRLAVEKAVVDLHGNNSAEHNAARAAFNNVGIGGGQGGDYEEDLEVNDGNDFILATDEQESDLYWVPPTNPNQFVKLEVPAPLSKPSFTDDGTAAVYVDWDNNMILLSFDWSGGGLNYSASYLEGNPQGIWRNIAVSKDGSKIAYTTVNLLNEIGVYDFPSDQEEVFLLFNPTTAQGVSTGDVLYADALEWDYTGEYIMYDALNRIESAFGDGIEYWDIGFINVWEYDQDNFTDGLIDKLFNSLPENISIGNPSFAKNSPYIITFDYLESYYDNLGDLLTDYWVLAANIEAGELNEIYQNTTIGYPSYSRTDDRILFTYDDFGSLLLATIDVQPSNKIIPVTGTDVVLINGAQKGVWFQTGNRNFTSVEDVPSSNLVAWPNPVEDKLFLQVSDHSSELQYLISNVQGLVIARGSAVSKSGIDVTGLHSGLYWIELKSGENSVGIARFIKK